MKVLVLGGGVIGVTTAWYMAEAGHEVVVVEQRLGVARETSFANAGQISPGYASPWAAPGIPIKALQWLLMRHAPLILEPRIDLPTLSWLAAMVRNCTEQRYAVNKRRMVRLADFSRMKLAELRDQTGIHYDQGARGTLQLFRTSRQLDNADKDVAVLKAYGVPFEILDAAGCIAVEPGLAYSDVPIAGGLRLPDDETGDCHMFTTKLAELARRRGVTFLYDRVINGIVTDRGSVVQVETHGDALQADAYVIALGSASRSLAAQVGIKLPIYPVKGYSITLPISDEAHAPVSTILDESYKVAITRLGNRIRVGGIAELSGYTSNPNSRGRATLEHSVKSLFPKAGGLLDADLWSGLRPMTPDGTPVVGATEVSNLFLNTGHGTLGWTMACGSGHILSDIVSGKAPAIEANDLGYTRYH
ncbi:MAG: D-amino acid dehydrogenase [Sphingobium sp.]